MRERGRISPVMREAMAAASSAVNGAAIAEHAPCQIWGVLNVTPDSFSDGGQYLESSHAVQHALAMAGAGAAVIDVGGESSRPAGAVYGAPQRVTEEAEQARVLPVVGELAQAGIMVSIDTAKAGVARATCAAGARIINDVSCGASAELLEVAAAAAVDLVLMHNRGQGECIGANVEYQGDVVGVVRDELLAAAERAAARGVSTSRIWLDPGIGFAKTAAQSAELLAHLETFVKTGYRVLVGPSRKSFIAQLAPAVDGSVPDPGERIGGTAAAVAISALSGVHAVRVHDVAIMRQAALLASRLRQMGQS